MLAIAVAVPASTSEILAWMGEWQVMRCNVEHTFYQNDHKYRNQTASKVVLMTEKWDCYLISNLMTRQCHVPVKKPIKKISHTVAAIILSAMFKV